MARIERLFPTTDASDFRTLFSDAAAPEKASAGARIANRYEKPLAHVVERTLQARWRARLRAEAIANAWCRFLSAVRQTIGSAEGLQSGRVRELAGAEAAAAAWQIEQAARREQRRWAPAEAGDMGCAPAPAIEQQRLLMTAWESLLNTRSSVDREKLEGVGLARFLTSFETGDQPDAFAVRHWRRLRRDYRHIVQELLRAPTG